MLGVEVKFLESRAGKELWSISLVTLESFLIPLLRLIDLLSMVGSSKISTFFLCVRSVINQIFYRVEGKGPYVVNTNFVIVQGKLTIGTPEKPYDGKITFNLTLGNYSYGWTRPDGEDSAGVKGFVVVSTKIYRTLAFQLAKLTFLSFNSLVAQLS